MKRIFPSATSVAVALAIGLPTTIGSLMSVSCRTTTEGREVPAELRAKALDFENRKAKCVRLSRNDDEYAKCLGVDWEVLKTDQTGLHEHRDRKGELHAD